MSEYKDYNRYGS